ncbi:hypothetical protein HBH70_039210 [Parastagonospora nodorum]|nr:hypothetical protein HBH52_044500 [Parastagonospora nodorum]KAH4109461.1 hypothetical protein HBH46_027500 [Parastagonospora nodorum]KAH4272468.1 hypothetical protein HBI03_025530 [Parastagonospora nodorum]KAH4277149.1 hypothetical protein HBI04_104360 [Parastagonospora nodorum]KAH4608844.1 hypothetical protein HBH82_067620 [Parastagonospora nodorum]
MMVRMRALASKSTARCCNNLCAPCLNLNCHPGRTIISHASLTKVRAPIAFSDVQKVLEVVQLV